jgi:hypothetical protein
MRVAGVLFLPALAALACVAFLEIATGGPQPVTAGDAQSFVWKKRVFKNKQQFETWLERRNVSYADWEARHPKASPPWNQASGDDGLGAFSLLVAAFAGFAAFFVLTRDAVRRSARRQFAALLARLRREELFRPFAEAGIALSLRDAVSVYGLRPPGGAEPPREADRPELALVESPRVESPVEPPPEPVVVEPPPGPAVAVDPEPEIAAHAAPPRPPRSKRRPAKTAVEKPPPVAAAPAEEPARDEPEPQPAASEPEPDPAMVAAAPRPRARRATQSPRKAAVKLAASVAPAAVEKALTPEPVARPATSLRVSEAKLDPTAPSAESEAPRRQPVNDPVRIDDAGRQTPASPTFPFREVHCEVAFWRGFFKGQFYARIWGGDESSAIATSPMFRCRSATAEQTEECLAALAALHAQLLAEGWEPSGSGRAWYATRFTNHVPI